MKATIPFSDFSRLDLRVGTIQTADPVEGADNLLKITVDLGEVGKRQLIAGLRKSHTTSDLVGKQIVVVVNLEEKEIRGLTSSGMLLAADCEEKPILISPQEEVVPGTTIR
ncbi:MAG: methionine--tRNA ligase [Candidatus Chisholmbacteria bacterium RIFCSPLOWO2_01_FULL_50_28]|uniref:Methionine--tRNA ligase n=1 Tax=Candidatus Chisholmbacteria bacterium RIFCSPHIGHO2_01_FULL_52_32 TaxID=1797591 RepID=A0A1G1VQV3_9BACT|nr:MAG: methionine--tRNA ligase [Candidatus Chisholmbacteria bacterium RIFCSPHIGHO2_01_FULL_52_32]OGY20680.1 MAG: methionine--tRNA ligase [Candidatus Chisholmbacteria bacterium RIFCSPLOWO2_01_FULL_50_28]